MLGKSLKFSAISDVHVSHSKDSNFDLLMEFLTNSFVVKSDYIFLLGDIFDLMVGNHKQYLVEFEYFFQTIAKLTQQGCHVIYVEGNHDLHLTRLWAKAVEMFSINPSNLHLERKEYSLTLLDGSVLYLCHGDEIEDNPKYLKYKNFIHSKTMELIADFFMPYRVLEHFGRKASQTSRQSNQTKYSTQTHQVEIRDYSRKMAKRKLEVIKAQVLICGHSHYKDFIEFDHGLYINNGFAPESKTFIYYENSQFDFKPLTGVMKN